MTKWHYGTIPYGKAAMVFPNKDELFHLFFRGRAWETVLRVGRKGNRKICYLRHDGAHYPISCCDEVKTKNIHPPIIKMQTGPSARISPSTSNMYHSTESQKRKWAPTIPLHWIKRAKLLLCFDPVTCNVSVNTVDLFLLTWLKHCCCVVSKDSENVLKCADLWQLLNLT